MNQSQSKIMNSGVLVFLTLLFTSGCIPSAEQQGLLDSLNGGSSQNIPMPNVPSGCYDDRYVEPAARLTGSVDLLFVTHTTDTFLSVRSEVADGIINFISALPPDVDYQVAIILAHSQNSSWYGKLYNAPNYPAVLSSKSMTQTDLLNDLKYNFTNTVQDPTAELGEEGLNSLHGALTGAGASYAESLGFFRANAGLGVVMMANEGDICGLPSTDPGTDSDWAEENAIAMRDCAGISAISDYNLLQAFADGRPFALGGVIYTSKSQQPINGVEAEYGWGYADFVHLGNGVTVDLATANVNNGLAQIGNLLTTKLSLQLDFTLSHSNTDPNSIQVYVDGASDPNYLYRPITNQVHVSQPGGANSVVDIVSCPAQTPPTTPPTPGTCVGPLCNVLGS